MPRALVVPEAGAASRLTRRSYASYPSHEALAKHLQAPYIEPWRAVARRCGLMDRKFTAYEIAGAKQV